MWWLWIVGPVAVGLIFMLTGQVDQRVLQEIEAWREQLGARREKLQKKSSKKKKTKDPRPKAVGSLPRDFARLIEMIGEGRVVGQYELAPKVAYARFVTSDAEGSSDYQCVVVRLAEPGPTFTARPLPLYDETTRVPNTGIEFRKDPEFASTYLIEADPADAKVVGRWLSRDLRELLCEHEHDEVWLQVHDTTMALTVYGNIRAERMAMLMDVAEVFVAEHGAEDGPSLYGETDRSNVKEKERATINDDEDEDEDAA